MSSDITLYTAKCWAMDLRNATFNKGYKFAAAEWTVLKLLNVLPLLRYVTAKDDNEIHYIFDQSITVDQIVNIYDALKGVHYCLDSETNLTGLNQLIQDLKDNPDKFIGINYNYPGLIKEDFIKRCNLFTLTKCLSLLESDLFDGD